MLDRDIKMCIREVGGMGARSVEEVMECVHLDGETSSFQLQSDHPILPNGERETQ